MKNKYEIEISEITSLGIRAEAKRIGATHARKIGAGYQNKEEGSDFFVKFYAMPNPETGYEFLAAETNGDPVFFDESPSEFSLLAEQCGVRF